MTKDKPKAISMKPCTKFRTYAITIASRPKRHRAAETLQEHRKGKEDRPMRIQPAQVGLDQVAGNDVCVVLWQPRTGKNSRGKGAQIVGGKMFDSHLEAFFSV